MPAKFMTFTQHGADFIVHDSSDKSIKDETWGIERLAAFMSYHYTLNTCARKYMKGATFVPAVGAIQYSCEGFDQPTSRDIDKLTAYLVPRLCAFYSDPTKQGYLGRPLPQVLDDVEALAKEWVANEETPFEAFGQVTPRPRFYSRPTREEYDEELRLKEEKSKLMWDRFRDVLNSGKAAGHRISIREGKNVYSAIITKVSEKSVYCDLKDEYGRVLQSGARIPRNSPRFIIESFI